MKIRDVFGNELLLSEARLNHIKEKHPEITVDIIKNSLSDPDYIIKSALDENIKIYHKKKEKYFIVVVLHVNKRLTVTAYTSDKLKKGTIEWTKT